MAHRVAGRILYRLGKHHDLRRIGLTARLPVNRTLGGGDRFAKTELVVMAGPSLRHYRAGFIALAGLLAIGASAYAVTHQRNAAAERKLQELADTAALAGVNALVTSTAPTDAQRLEDANTAARVVLASHGATAPRVLSSLDELTTSVAMTTGSVGKSATITATAHYVPPGAAISPNQTADATARKRIRG